MRIRWRDFELPSRVELDKETATSSYGRFVVEPFQRGFGTTIGNGLRRVLLSSIEGAAIISVKIEGVLHEFSTIDGVYEDMTNVILNIKKLRLRMDHAGPVEMQIDVKRKGEVTAADIEAPAGVEIVNRDLKICTLTDNIRFVAMLNAQKGRGYESLDENVSEDAELGTIAVDSLYSPVYRVRYHVEATRLGKDTNYDRLVFEIWTDGTVNPEMALVEASKIALARILVDGGSLRIATDHAEYCRWILSHLLAHPGFAWAARTPRDWRVRPADWPETRYEAKARRQGRASTYLTFVRAPRSAAAEPTDGVSQLRP